MNQYKSFEQLMAEANQAGAMTAEQIAEYYRQGKSATPYQLATLQEVMGRKHSTSFEPKRKVT